MRPDSFGAVAGTYDAIAHQYRNLKNPDMQGYVHQHTLLRLTGDLSGKNVIDLACGDGHYTRILKQAGAARTLGIDISPTQIQLALEEEKNNPIGCRYRIADVADLTLTRQFDMATAMFLLNYASNRSQLLSLVHAIVRALKPGGTFIGLNANMALDPAFYDDCKKYGKKLRSPPNRVEGDIIKIHLLRPDGAEVSFNNYYLSPRTYESVFTEAGFRDFTWIKPEVSQEGIAAHEPGFWDAFLKRPPTIFIHAVR